MSIVKGKDEGVLASAECGQNQGLLQMVGVAEFCQVKAFISPWCHVPSRSRGPVGRTPRRFCALLMGGDEGIAAASRSELRLIGGAFLQVPGCSASISWWMPIKLPFVPF